MRVSFKTQTGPEGTLVVSRPCVFTGVSHSVTVPEEGWLKFQGGAFVQDAFPSLSAEDREFLLSGISPKGWALLGPEED